MSYYENHLPTQKTAARLFTVGIPKYSKNNEFSKFNAYSELNTYFVMAKAS